MKLDIVRDGPDRQPSTARRVLSDFGIVVSAVAPGCRTVSHTQLAPSQMAISFMLDVAPGTRWCGDLDLGAGQSVIHQPRAEHTAINMPGTRFAFSIIDTDAMVERSEVLEIPLQPWRPGDVDLVPAGGSGSAAPILTHLASAPIHTAPARLLDDLLTAISLSMTNQEAVRRLPATMSVNSRKVVGDCIDFADTIRREPSIAEMCLASNVGARRLRQAFHDTLQVSPTRFFRRWVLCEAHQRLLVAAPGTTSVTRVATDLGLTHLGRFSTQYRELHGESPSTTLRR